MFPSRDDTKQWLEGGYRPRPNSICFLPKPPPKQVKKKEEKRKK